MIKTIFDTESNGFLETATKVWCMACVDKDSKEEVLFIPKDIYSGLELLSKSDVLVGHNILKHDLPLLKKVFSWEPLSHQIVLDTLVFSRLLNPKRPLPEGATDLKTHSIENWAKRFGMFKPEHNDWEQYSNEKGVRCLEDARINLKVLEALENEADALSGYYQQLKYRRCA